MRVVVEVALQHILLQVELGGLVVQVSVETVVLALRPLLQVRLILDQVAAVLMEEQLLLSRPAQEAPAAPALLS